MKTCSMCGVEKDETSFYTGKGNKNGRMAHCKQCHRQMSLRTPTGSSKEYFRETARERRRRFPALALYRQARNRAQQTGLEFSIEPTDVHIPAVCPLLGIPLEVASGWGIKNPRVASLDRIDSAKGYVKGNVWVISWRANKIKNDATLEELRAIVRGLERRQYREAA